MMTHHSNLQASEKKVSPIVALESKQPYMDIDEAAVRVIIRPQQQDAGTAACGCLSEHSATLLPEATSPLLRLGIESSNKYPEQAHQYFSEQQMNEAVSSGQCHHCVSEISMQAVTEHCAELEDWELLNSAL